MKSISLILICLLFSFPSFAQETNDTTTAAKKNKWNTGVFISGGGNSLQYLNDNFFHFMNNNQDDIHIKNFDYNKSLLSPNLNIGIILSPDNKKKLRFNHVIEVGFIQISGRYSGSGSFQNTGHASTTVWNETITDTLDSKYFQKIISVGYKIQPTYKFIFFSFGVNCFYNIIKEERYDKRFVNGFWEDIEFGPFTPQPYTKNSITNTTKRSNFVNVSLQVGAGGYIKFKRIILKPAFSFTPSFKKGYNFYNTSLGIGYSLKK
ncbi:MAG: hypothetical protein HY840_03185 [Bacteroidetes bacterium]|nr:hypothetical protein [Bacteroidota bacterium]